MTRLFQLKFLKLKQPSLINVLKYDLQSRTTQSGYLNFKFMKFQTTESNQKFQNQTNQV